MGYIVAPGSENAPWIRAMIERHEKLKRNATPTGEPDVIWSPNEWRGQEHLHQQHHHHQQQLQEQQLRQQQYQQRQRLFRYRQQQQHYDLQQQYEASRRWQHHQQYYKRATTKKTSGERVVDRAVRQETQAEKGGVPPTSQTTSKPPSVCEYPVGLSALQPVCSEPPSIDDELLDSMENGLLGKPAKKAEEVILEESVQELEEPQQSLQAAQPRPRLPEEPAGKGDLGVLGKDLVVAGGLAVSAGGAGVEEERPPPSWDDDKFPISWLAPDQTGLEIAIWCAQTRFPTASREVDDGKVVLGEDGEHAPPLLQQQQELQAAPPQDPWPPPVEQEGSGAGTCGEDGLGLEGFSITRLDFSSGCGSDDILSCGNGYCTESSGNGDDEEDTVDGRVWERVGIGTGARSRASWGSEVASRRLTQRRRERVREK